jgi:hypothetical protein
MSHVIDTTKLVRGTREYFTHVVGCYVCGMDIAPIVEVCMAEFAAGRNCSVWHCSSIVLGTLDRCPCDNCRSQVGPLSKRFGKLWQARYGESNHAFRHRYLNAHRLAKVSP